MVARIASRNDKKVNRKVAEVDFRMGRDLLSAKVEGDERGQRGSRVFASDDWFSQLLPRCDGVPESLALTQKRQISNPFVARNTTIVYEFHIGDVTTVYQVLLVQSSIHPTSRDTIVSARCSLLSSIDPLFVQPV
jgi:pullulanase/glycogen debranching enzyme